MALHSTYLSEIQENLNYIATWLPTVTLEPGDVCDMSGGELRRVGNLNDFRIQAELVTSDVESEIHYASTGSVSMHVKAKGEPPPTGSVLTLDEAGISLAFSKSGSVVLQLTGCTGASVRNLLQVGNAVLNLHKLGEWPSGHIVVTETVRAGASTILISSEAGASIDLSAGAKAVTGGVSLANLNASLDVKSQSKIGAQFVSAPGLTPLVRTRGVKRQFFRPDQFKGGEAVESDSFQFVDVDYDTASSVNER